MASAMVCYSRFQSPCHTTDRSQGNPMPTPSNHRTQLGPVASNSSRLGTGGFRNTAGIANRGLQSQTPAHQPSFAGINTNTLSRPSMSGYGLSAGLKVGKQSSWSLLWSFQLWNRRHLTLLIDDRSSPKSTQSRPPAFQSAWTISGRRRRLLLIVFCKGTVLLFAHLA